MENIQQLDDMTPKPVIIETPDALAVYLLALALAILPWLLVYVSDPWCAK